ncbi:fibrinogen C domain-containing protein 1-like [Daphnia pulex]|uniref:fibrinogen C domain-containing protein 1-like n=1 Tax=Daphnia pulex TaxID=6669 RepID=UPI001EDDF642|nr:fibrinogen C domain-containing protein 1-like [Daphnia pulex]
MGRSSAALARRTSSGAIHLALVLYLLSVHFIGIEAQHEDSGTSSEESRADDPIGQESDTSEMRRPRPFNLIAPRPASNVVGVSTTPPSPTLAGGILNDVEHEPGLVWPTVTIPAATTPSTSDESGPTLTSGRLMAHLQRITERLSSMESLQIQTLRKLEGIDYRLTRVEVQMQERGDSVRNLAADTSRRLQQLESDVGRIETLLDVVRDESVAIRTGQAELKHIITQSGGAQAPARMTESDVPAPRLQVLLAGMNSLRTTTNNLRDELLLISKNVSVMANLTKIVEKRSDDFATKQDLHRGITALKSQDSTPARTLSHFIQPGACPSERPSLPRDCHDALNKGGRHLMSGIQRIQPLSSSAPFFVQCDMETRGGGWTVIQNRFDGSINFLRGWNDYKQGFGNMATEFWLGLEKIHMITNQGVYELLIELTDFGLNQATAHYTAFAIGSDAEGYDIRLLGTYEGDAGDSLSYHTSMKFSTADNDQDQWLDGNCARDHTGGWWYRGCDTSNLNGQYLNGPVPQEFEYKGMYWYDYQGPQYSLMKSRIMIRPFFNAVVLSAQPGGTTVKPRSPQVPAPPGNQGRPTFGPKLPNQQSQKPKKKKEME